MDTIALNCLVFWENRVFLHFGDRQTDKQTNRQTNIDALSRSRCRERKLNNEEEEEEYEDDDDDDNNNNTV